MKDNICKHCGAVNQHFSFQCPTQRKPIKTSDAKKNVEWHSNNSYKPAVPYVKVTPKKRINPVSDKQLKRLVKYAKLRDTYMSANEVCEASLPNCTGKSTELHHKNGREGENLFNHFMAVCNGCHHKIEIGGSWVYEFGFKMKRTEN